MVTIASNQTLGDSGSYEWKSASINIAGATATVDITNAGGITTLFNTIKRCRKIRIEASATTYIRLNSASNDIITVTATTPFEADMSVHKIFISTGGSASTVTVKLFA